MSAAEIIICIMVAISIAISGLSLAINLRKKVRQDSFTPSQEDLINERIKDLHDMTQQDGRAETNVLLVAINSANSALLAALQNSQDSLNTNVGKLTSQQNQDFTAMRSTLSTDLREARAESATQAKDMRENLERQLKALEGTVGSGLEKIRESNEKKLSEMTQSNEKKLNEMRGTVEEKLQSTIHERITTSFTAVTAQLAEVQKGLGEMQNLTSNVSNLNKVLNGVKSRGIWGEVSLEGLLEQMLSPAQYGKQVSIKKNNAVDFAIIMPGLDNNQTLLPIDAKFPFADYERLMQASEAGDKDGVAKARADLYKAVKEQAKSISTKYIDVPNTTNFAIMYLPIEGLYAEIAREAQIMHDMHSLHNVMLAGPSTLTALLTALQVGFRTLTMQKQSKDVWNALQEFKKNMTKFTGLLERSQKNANNIADDMSDSLKRINIIDKQLSKLEIYNVPPTLEDKGGDNEV